MKAAAFAWLAACTVAAGSPRLDFALGILAEQRGDAEAAAASIEKARAADPTAYPLVDRVASRKRALGDIEGASTLYREFAAARPERLDAQLAYADFLRQVSPGDDFASKLATATLEKALERFPAELAVQRRLFRAYEALGDREQSLALFESVAAAPQGPAGVLAAADMARTLFSKDDLTARARMDVLFREACRQWPSDPVLARAASEHFRTTSRLPDAVEMLRRHVEAEPSSLAVRTRLGILQLAAKDEAAGERTLLEVVAIDMNQALAHQSLAKLYRRREQVADARMHAAQALKVRGGGVGEFTELAEEFLAADLPRDARLLLEKALFFHPDDAGVAAKLAVATRRDPETRTQAPRLFRQAESLSAADGPAADPVFLTEFAECLLEAGQTKAAEDRLRSAIRSYSADQKKDAAVALRRLAGIWQAEKRNAEAADALLQRADALDPK
jgi:Tfp pilus assembly protein PilF